MKASSWVDEGCVQDVGEFPSPSEKTGRELNFLSSAALKPSSVSF
jgi:hypothetical protein